MYIVNVLTEKPPQDVEKNRHTKLQVVVFLRLGRRESNLGQMVFSTTIQVKFGKIAQHFRGRWRCCLTAASLVQTLPVL